MLSSVNKVTIVGTIGDKIELRHLDKGGAICRFSISTKDVFIEKSTGERKELTDWHIVTSWGDQAKEVYKKLKKGLSIYIEAKLKSRTWLSKEGVTHRGYELFLENYLVLSSENMKPEDFAPYSNEGVPLSPAPLTGFELSDLDELPF